MQDKEQRCYSLLLLLLLKGKGGKKTANLVLLKVQVEIIYNEEKSSAVRGKH